ncbi:glutaredoxin domain-containing protein [Streptococcus sp. Marseille-Q5986]|uniref:glutaredoxin domain-containing protein n=1 Tax=Streptococcus sp. Marseille-Q5986 TaxID=2972782 RepID=UPI0022655BBB|nr:glutaredoxin domain-containing protein [Streptococcus sp. Marseille-Q5986]
MANVTLYSKDNCVKCTQTKRLFDRYGIEYQEVNLLKHPDLIDTFKKKGFLEAPVVIAPHTSWCGFRMDEIKALYRVLQNTQQQLSVRSITKDVKSSSKELAKNSVSWGETER